MAKEALSVRRNQKLAPSLPYPEMNILLGVRWRRY